MVVLVLHVTHTVIVDSEYIRRVIVHPSFMNVSFDEAIKALTKMEQGEAVFRPSSKVHTSQGIVPLRSEIPPLPSAPSPPSFSHLPSSLSSLLPLTQGQDHLTLTWKVEEVVYQHVDIREQDKPNAYSLGRSLIIGEEVCVDV